MEDGEGKEVRGPGAGGQHGQIDRCDCKRGGELKVSRVGSSLQYPRGEGRPQRVSYLQDEPQRSGKASPLGEYPNIHWLLPCREEYVAQPRSLGVTCFCQ